MRWYSLFALTFSVGTIAVSHTAYADIRIETPHETVEISAWGRALVSIRVTEDGDAPLAGVSVDFLVGDTRQIAFPVPTAFTNREGRAFNVVDSLHLEVDTTFKVSVQGVESDPIHVVTSPLQVDGTLKFQAPPMPPFASSTATLLGKSCDFFAERPVGTPISAWSIDPTVAEISGGQFGELVGGCQEISLQVTALREGEAVFIIGTVDYSIYETPVTFTTSTELVRGDCNDDSKVDISDAVCMLNWLFLGGAVPGCIAVTNTNGDNAADISDAVYLLTHLFLGGPAPVAPFPDCGPSRLSSDRELGCVHFATCSEQPQRERSL